MAASFPSRRPADTAMWSVIPVTGHHRLSQLWLVQAPFWFIGGLSVGRDDVFFGKSLQRVGI